MTSKRAREGYLLIDHRDSPGVPAAMMEAAGLPAQAARGVYECPTAMCCHCNTVVLLNPARTRDRGYCGRCDAYVCDNPGCHAECRPFEQLLDQAQALVA